MSMSFPYLADTVRDLPRSGIRDFFAVVQQRPEAISLGVGEPDFVTPWHIREAAIYALEQGRTSYTDNRGLISFRREISRYVEKNFGMGYDPATEIITTVGVSEAIDIALRAILNPGDKVLYHEPCYVSYNPSIALAHGVAIPVQTKKDDLFALNVDHLRAAWQPGTKALMLNFPTNPTGAVFPKKVLEDIAAFAREKDLLILSDEIYAELTYDDQPHYSIADLPGMKERTLFLHGCSKAWAMTGFRIGYACGPKDWIEAMMKVHQYAMLCAPILSQEAAREALAHGDDSVAKMKERYCERRDFLARRFNEMGLDCHVPGGAFYLFPDIRSTGLSSMDFAKGLLDDDVAVVPGSAFGPGGEGFVRAAYSTSYDQLIEAADRIEGYLEKIGKGVSA
ncbi:MAG: aminotransferase class I/II-fold pyridoxal phosphate-dependent enzyme [Opitutales bacterium]|nr:aminotransferase class I/II-fold pyridoxal phosphate-dependent enzyme [Opitutales bacterium]